MSAAHRTTPPRSLLVVRDDRLGDFMLAWPAFALLRRALPETRITALVPEYTAPLARLCPSLDDVLVVSRAVRNGTDGTALAERLRDQNYEAVISFFSHYHTARAFRRAGIPIRIAPAVKLAQVHHTHRLPQHRSRSLKPEFRYNLDLAAFALELWRIEPPDPLEDPPYLGFPVDRRRAHARELRGQYGLEERASLIAVHPGHGGSARNLDLEGYVKLCGSVGQLLQRMTFLVTSGPASEERARAENLSRRLHAEGLPNRLHVSRTDLAHFALDLSVVDAFLSGSTGPLHLAACLGVPTVGFFPEKRSANATRWCPPAKEGFHLAVTRPEAAHGEALMPPSKEDNRRVCAFLERHLRSP
jgi:ADP-heptose:LPS heptosyltransferase